ncbi:MAG: hypothetical protein E7589_04735, partial [Ruminococcaceae bacterium]|nr:hypothetical protein [Oscillospiraceae bacterium]
MKKTLALLLAIVMVMTSAFTVFASDAAVDTTTPAYATEPETGVAYKFVVEQGNNGTTNYLTGETANTAYYLATSTDIDAGVDVYLEEAEDGYKMYFMVEDAKKYITIAASGTYVNAGFVDADACVFTWNTTYNTLTTVVNGTEYYLGSYNSFDTVSASKISYASSSFVSQLLKVETAVETEPVVETEELPLYGGTLPGNVAFGGTWTITSFGQKFTVASDKRVTAFTHQFGTANDGSGVLAFYAWDTDYATTVAGTPLCEIDFTCGNNETKTIEVPADVVLTGDLLWVITPNAQGNLLPYGASAVGEGCVDYVNGVLTGASGGSYNLSGWSGVVAWGATVTLVAYEAPETETTE